MSETYFEINKNIAKLQSELRVYRLKSVLKTLVNLKNKSRKITELENQLNAELAKTLQNSFTIDELLEEFEAIL